MSVAIGMVALMHDMCINRKACTSEEWDDIVKFAQSIQESGIANVSIEEFGWRDCPFERDGSNTLRWTTALHPDNEFRTTTSIHKIFKRITIYESGTPNATDISEGHI